MPKEVDLSRLATAMQKARRVLQVFREERRESVRQYLGRHYSDGGTKQIVPVNLISLYTGIISRQLIAKNPRVMLSTFDKNSKPVVTAMETWANAEIENMCLASTLQRIVLDALFSLGIAKVALSTPADAYSSSWQTKAGSAFCERVDLDDFVFDVNARDFREASYIGHRYRVPLEAIRDSTLYSPARKDLVPSTNTQYNSEGDDRISTLGRGDAAGDSEEFEDFVDLWEVYIPRKRVVLTLSDQDITGSSTGGAKRFGKPLREQNWLGPDEGPYRMLAFGIVPGNAMPKGPIQDLIDLHELTNRIYRKLGDQSDRQKEVLTVQGGAMEDGNRIMNATDGQIIAVDNPEKTKKAEFGGPNQQNLAFGMHIKDMFSYLAGNLDMMGGLSPQSKTLGQDKLLAASASQGVSDMQDTTVNFTAGVIKGLCWFWYHDPFKVMRMMHTVPGVQGFQFQRSVTPQQRQQTAFDDLKISVDPYSLQHSTPQSRLQTLSQLFTQMLPLMQLLSQQGISLDLNAYLQKVAKYADMPDLPEILTVSEPPQQNPVSQDDSGGGGAMPQETTRNYVRTSQGSGRTGQGTAHQMIQAMGSSSGENERQDQMAQAG